MCFYKHYRIVYRISFEAVVSFVNQGVRIKIFVIAGMLISKIPDNDNGKGESIAVPEEENDSDEYQTANQLFELMAKNQNFDNTGKSIFVFFFFSVWQGTYSIG